MLAEWPDTVTEMAIQDSAAKMAEHAAKQKFDQLTHEQVKIKIASAVSKTAVKVGEFSTMPLSLKVMNDLACKNTTRGKKNAAVQLGPPHYYRLQGDLLQVRRGRDPCHEGCRLLGLPFPAVLPHAA